MLPLIAYGSDFKIDRQKMVQLITQQSNNLAVPISKPVIQALNEIPRHYFVPKTQIHHAYENRPLPIGFGQTISQPLIVAMMTQLANPTT